MTTVYIYPPESVAVSVPPTQFVKNGVNTTVTRNTDTPSLSEPLPVISLDSAGVPVTPLTDAQLRAAAVPVSASSLPLPSGAATLAEQQTQSTRLGDVVEVAPATDTASSGINGRLQRIAQRLSSLISLLPASLGQKTSAASLAVVISSDQSAVPVSGPLTDVQLRAAAVPVSGPLTDAQLRATAVPVSGPLTDAQIRATALPVSGPLTDAQLRATAVPVSLASSPAPAVNAGTVTSTQKSVGTAAVRATVDGLAPSASRKKLMIKPSGNNTGKIFLGGSGVLTSNGFEIVGPDRIEFEFDSGDYYLISDTAGQVVDVLEKI